MTKRNLGIKLIIATVAVLYLCTGSIAAQTNFMGSLHFNMGLPQGELKDQIDANAYGFGGQIFYTPRKSPIAIGLEVDWMNYGSETREEPFSTTIPDVTVDVETTNNVLQGFLVLRGQMPTGSVELYGDALLGINYLFTETSISGTGFDFEDVVSSTNFDDAAFAYGIGGGLMVPVYERKKEAGKGGPVKVYIDGGARYIFGGEAEYLKKGSIRRTNGTVSFDAIKSKTDLVKIHLGVAVRF